MVDQTVIKANTLSFYPGESVTWIGQGRSVTEICLGFESGTIQLFDLNFTPLSGRSPVLGSGEAINGVVFWGDRFAASSPADFIMAKWSENMLLTFRGRMGGAHGLAVSNDGIVGASMGCEGLRFGYFEKDDCYFRDYKNPTREMCHYQSTSLSKDAQEFTWFASACRADGLVLTAINANMDFGPEMIMSPNSSHAHFGLDAISVCKLNLSNHPYSMAVLGIDGTIHLSKDPRSNYYLSKHSNIIKGTAYSVHCVQGHLVVLTSDKIYIIEGAAQSVLQPFPVDMAISAYRTLVFDLDAVECSIIGDKFLSVLYEDRVTLTLISDFFQHSRTFTASPAHKFQVEKDVRLTIAPQYAFEENIQFTSKLLQSA